MPSLAAEGSDVLLLAHNMTKNPLGYAWFRGDRVENTQLIASYRVDINATANGPAHSGRETIYPNGTLLIQNITQNDTGSYMLLITKNDLQTERQTGHLHVLRECFLSDLGVLGEVNSVHTLRTDRPRWRLRLPLHYVPCWGLNIQCRAHTMETNSKGSEFHSGDLDPADAAERRTV